MTNISNNSPNFGMALHMKDKTKLIKRVGNYAANEAEKVRPQLSEMAKDVEIFVKPYSLLPFSKDISSFAFMVRVHDKFENIKNPIKRFLCQHGVLKPLYAEKRTDFITGDRISKDILATANYVKETFHKIK